MNKSGNRKKIACKVCVQKRGDYIDPTTEYAEWQRPLSGVHSIMMEKLVQAGEGGEGTRPPHLKYLPSCSS
jgi:hypothetical protein